MGEVGLALRNHRAVQPGPGGLVWDGEVVVVRRFPEADPVGRHGAQQRDDAVHAVNVRAAEFVAADRLAHESERAPVGGEAGGVDLGGLGGLEVGQGAGVDPLFCRVVEYMVRGWLRWLEHQVPTVHVVVIKLVGSINGNRCLALASLQRYSISRASAVA